MKYEWKIEYVKDEDKIFSGKNYHSMLEIKLNDLKTYEDGWEIFAITEHVGFSFRLIMRRQRQ